MKIEAEGMMVKGKVKLDNSEEFADKKSCFPDGRIKVTIEKETTGNTKRMRGYYWSTLAPHMLIILREQCGYLAYKTREDAHEFLKYRYNPVYVPDVETGEMIRMPGSTKKMTKEQRIKFIDDIIIDGQTTFGYTYPPPRNKKDKYNLD